MPLYNICNCEKPSRNKLQLNTEATSKHNIGTFIRSFVVHTYIQIKHEKTLLNQKAYFTWYVTVRSHAEINFS